MYAEIICTGEELLDGSTKDKNSSTIAKTLSALGFRVDRISIVPDDLPDIVRTVTAALHAQRPRLVVTTGGLGPTWDDLTHEAIALALQRDMVTDAKILDLIEQHIGRKLNADDDIAAQEPDGGAGEDVLLRRIARIPCGAEAIVAGPTEVGALTRVDGGLTSAEGCSIASIPGPPHDAVAVMSRLVAMLPSMGSGPKMVTRHWEFNVREHVIAAAMDVTRKIHPELRFGSYSGNPNSLCVSGPTHRMREAIPRIEKIVRSLEHKGH